MAGDGLREAAEALIADVVLNDLSDRSGVGDELSMIDAETMAEIRQSIGSKALTALLALLDQRGFAVVPKEPQPEMVAAFWRTKNAGHRPQPAPVDTSDYAAYRAMLAEVRNPFAEAPDGQ